MSFPQGKGENMSQRKLMAKGKKYALLLPAVAAAGFAAAGDRPAAPASPSLSDSTPASSISDLIALATAEDVSKASGSMVAGAGAHDAEAFQDNGTVDSDDPVGVLLGGLS